MTLALFTTALPRVHLGLPLALVTSALMQSVLPLLIHEAGHAAAAQWYGLPWRLRFGWLGPAVHVTGRYVARENAAVALGGPVMSAVGALAVWWAGYPACAVVVGLIGAANGLDFWHAVQAYRMKEGTA